MPNPHYRYYSHMMVKVWEAYCQNKASKFFIDAGRIEPVLFSGAGNMGLQHHAALVLDANDQLYVSQQNYSLSIVDEVNSINHTQGVGFNGAVGSLENAIEQIQVWNTLHPAEKIQQHHVIFPYQRKMNHWCLGVLVLSLNDGLVYRAEFIVYEPLSKQAVISVNQKTKLRALMQRFNANVDFSVNIRCTEQQFDGASCGAISAENGKDIIDGLALKTSIKYPAGAINLRQQHINEVDNPLFERSQAEEVLVKNSKASENTKLFTKELVESLVKLSKKYKDGLIQSLRAFQLDYQGMTQEGSISMPFDQLKKFFTKSLSASKKEISANDRSIVQAFFNALFKNAGMNWRDDAIDELSHSLNLILRSLAKKQVSNSFSTGGGGENYEAKVRAYYTVKLLSGAFVPPVNWSAINKIHVQAREKDYQTDDLVLVSEEGQRLLIQVKHAINFISSSDAFTESIAQFWIDYCNPEVFNVESDAFSLTFAVADGHLSEVSKQLQSLRHVADLAEYQKKYPSAKKSKGVCNIFDLVGGSVRKIAPDVSDQAIFEFTKKMYFFKLECDNECLAGIYTELKNTTDSLTEAGVKALWAEIVKEGSEYALTAGTITRDNLPASITKYMQAEGRAIDGLDGWGRDRFPIITSSTAGANSTVAAILTKLREKRLVAICGMHGVGKTHLGLVAASQISDPRYRLYLKAGSKEELDTDYTALAEKLRLPITRNTQQEVMQVLSQRPGGLFFFDGAPNYQAVRPYIPAGSRCVFTTISKAFKRSPVSCVHIRKMTLAEAGELVEQRLKNHEIVLDKDEVKRLCRLLGCLPLAIVQACGYIMYNDETIQAYCDFYEKHTKQALEGSGQSQEDFIEHKAVYFTWDISFQRLTDRAKRLLQTMVYFNCSQLTREFFLFFWQQENENGGITEALNELVEYCLVERTDKYLLLHKILKAVLLHKNEEANSNEKIIHELLVKFQEKFTYHRTIATHDLNQLNLMTAHLDNLMSHGEKININWLIYQGLIESVANFFIDAHNDAGKANRYLRLMEGRAVNDSYYYLRAKVQLRFGKAEQAYELFLKYLEASGKTVNDLNVYELCVLANILIKFYPKTDYPRIDAWLRRARDDVDQDDEVFSQVPSKNERQESIRDAHEILKLALDKELDDSPRRAMVLHYLGNYHWMLTKRYKDALNYYQQALKMKQVTDPNNEREIARTQHNIGLCYMRLNEFANALEQFQLAYDIRKQHRFSDETLASLKSMVKVHELQYKQEKDKEFLVEIRDTLLKIKDIRQLVGAKLANTYCLLIMVCLRLDQKAEAKQYLDLAFEKNTKPSKKLLELKQVVGSKDIRDCLGGKKLDELIGGALDGLDEEVLSEDAMGADVSESEEDEENDSGRQCKRARR